MYDRIVYEDADLLVVNKPAGMPTQSSQLKKGPNLYSELKKLMAMRNESQDVLALHHRLDAATCGLVLFCKTPKFNGAITDLFREKKIVKKYLAFVDVLQQPKDPKWTVQNRLKEYRFRHYKKSKADPEGQLATTHFILLKQVEDQALVECQPVTGRLHQIRVHLSDCGLPIKGDFHYHPHWKEGATAEFGLCAYSLEFPHPKSGETVKIEIESPFRLAES